MAASDGGDDTTLAPSAVLALCRDFVGGATETDGLDGDGNVISAAHEPQNAEDREEGGCMLWDLASSPANAQLMLVRRMAGACSSGFNCLVPSSTDPHGLPSCVVCRSTMCWTCSHASWMS